MHPCRIVIASLFLASAGSAFAQSYALSPDGSAVVRADPVGMLSAVALGNLPAGYSAVAGTGGTMSTSDYQAAFQGGNGGATIRALYDNGTAPAAGQGLQWVQVITTNSPLGGATSPYLDNAITPSAPYYSYTVQNRNPSLPSSQLNFYDFSKRSPATLSTTNPVTWSAALYPVVTNGSALTVHDGVSWGWTMKPAMVGSTAGTFVDPTPSTGPGHVLTGLSPQQGRGGGDAPGAPGDALRTDRTGSHRAARRGARAPHVDERHRAVFRQSDAAGAAGRIS